MFTVIIFAIIGTFIFIKIFYKKRKHIPEFYLICMFTGGLLFSLVGFVVAIAIPTKTEIAVDTYYLTPLDNDYNFLGKINDGKNIKYVYNYKTNDGISEGNYLYSYNTTIKYIDYNSNDKISEENNLYSNDISFNYNKPKVEFYYEKVKDSFINKFSINGCSSYENKNIIYIPKKSIINNY